VLPIFQAGHEGSIPFARSTDFDLLRAMTANGNLNLKWPPCHTRATDGRSGQVTALRGRLVTTFLYDRS